MTCARVIETKTVKLPIIKKRGQPFGCPQMFNIRVSLLFGDLICKNTR